MSNAKPMNRKTLKKITGTALCIAVLLAMALSGLGKIPITPTGITILQVPVIIATLYYGLDSGLLCGLCFGAWSLYNAYMMPLPLSVPFMNPLIAIPPRLCIPIVVFFLMKAMHYEQKTTLIKTAVLGAIGSLVNTALVLMLLGIFYGGLVQEVLNLSSQGLGIGLLIYGLTSGIPEAIVTAVLSVGIMAMLLKGTRKDQWKRKKGNAPSSS